MFSRLNADQWLGLLVCVAALGLIFVWVPLDVDSGLIEKVRRQITIGDSLGPVFAGVVLLLGGALCLLRPAAAPEQMSRANLRWAATVLCVVAGSMFVMRYVGPAVIDLFADKPYRALRATPPWNYAGYLLGGTCLVAALIALVRGRFSASVVLIGLIASVILALLYDLPFDDLQLPPNGDV